MGSCLHLMCLFLTLLVLIKKHLVIYLMCLFLLLLVSIRTQRRKLARPMSNLPPGSMGWPFLGETLQLYSQNPNLFFATRQKRYGDVFKSHILGCSCVMLASPEAIRFVLVSKPHLFKPTYPPSKEKLIGPSALFFHQGAYHTQIRKLVQASLSLDAIRCLVPDIEAIAIFALQSWSGGHVINTFRELKKFTFNVAVLSIFGHLEAHHKEKLNENYYTLDKGYNSFPTNLPGTLYNNSVWARKRLSLVVGEIIKERKDKKFGEKDLLGRLLNFKDEKGQNLQENQIVDNIIGVLFAAQDTTASMLTWFLKYIHDNSKLFEAIKMEQKAIYDSNEGGKHPLTWSQTRNMPLTNRAIMECLRMASIISFTFREAVEDVEYKGYLIPKGWKVLPLFRNIHHNADFFTEPHTFDPSRFEVGLKKPNTFMPFGNGVHACPGNEVAKLQMLIFIHHLLNNFRWEVVGSSASDAVQYKPFPVPNQGLPAKFWMDPAAANHNMYGTGHNRI